MYLLLLEIALLLCSHESLLPLLLFEKQSSFADLHPLAAPTEASAASDLVFNKSEDLVELDLLNIAALLPPGSETSVK